MEESKHIIAVDWGTSNFRAFLFTKQLELTGQIQSDRGIRSLDPSAQAQYLQKQLEVWLREFPDTPVYACGMLGSNLGYLPAPYLKLPLDIEQMYQHIQNHSKLGVSVIPGLSYESPSIDFDVIRGEETLVLGCIEQFSQDWICLPGTHSKWVKVDKNKRITSFSTIMTGEVFDIVHQHSILCEGPQEECIESFREGVQDANDDQHLLHAMFKARTRSLKDPTKKSKARSYLSGLIIGRELYHSTQKGEMITLCCSENLAKSYAEALTIVGCQSQWMDSTQALLKGILMLHKQIQGSKI
ncbi:MAG: 2-dehydro-3-deoxygalactonokinase [Bdellovibrionales bacterium]|nr:2-dehydro-3-deoxygalactonokinase [Bdellovibrionales bacterium]